MCFRWAARTGGIPGLAQPSHERHEGRQTGGVSGSAVAHWLPTGAVIVFAWCTAESQAQSALVEL